MSKLKVHRLTISEGGDIILACRIRCSNAGGTWIPKLVTCKTCKRVVIWERKS